MLSWDVRPPWIYVWIQTCTAVIIQLWAKSARAGNPHQTNWIRTQHEDKINPHTSRLQSRWTWNSPACFTVRHLGMKGKKKLLRIIHANTVVFVLSFLELWVCEWMVSTPASYWDCWDTLQHHLSLTKERDGWMAPEDRTFGNASNQIRFYWKPLRLLILVTFFYKVWV